jgi:hypothetical protein
VQCDFCAFVRGRRLGTVWWVTRRVLIVHA